MRKLKKPYRIFLIFQTKLRRSFSEKLEVSKKDEVFILDLKNNRKMMPKR